MASIETALNREQILEGIRQLSDQDKRVLAFAILNDRQLEAFVEELDDQLSCERADEDGPPQTLSPAEM